MRSNIWILVSGRNESSSSKNTPIMYWMTLAVILLGSTCLADENAKRNEGQIMKEAEDNIRWLRQAKERVEREEREKNSLATLTDLMIKDSFDSQLMSKIDILYDNQTDLTKELKFVPQVFNCGKEFDIFKVLELAKAHRNITTESPPCIVDTEENLCTTKRTNGGNNNNNNGNNRGNGSNNNANKTMRTVSQGKEGPLGVSALVAQSILSTKMPMGQQPLERRTVSSAIRQPSANPQTKTIKLKSQNKEKPSVQEKEVGGKLNPSHLQKQFVPKVSNNMLAIAEPSLDDVQLRENPQISEDQPQIWYPAQVEESEPQQYLSIENQNKNDAEVRQGPQISKPEAPSESLQQQVKIVQSPMVQAVPQQTQAIEQPSPFQVVEQPQGQNVVINDMSKQKLPGLEKTPKEVSDHGDQIEQGDQRTIIHDNKKQEVEKKGSGVTQTQQQSQPINKPVKQTAVQQSPTQSQVAEQQQLFNQQQLLNSEKRTQQQYQPIEKQNQQQPQTLEKQNQQQPQSLEKQNQQPQSLEKQNQLQLQTAEQHNQQKIQTSDKTNQQQFQVLEQQNQQSFQVLEKQNQQQLQTGDPIKQQQFQTMEKHNPQLQTSEKHNQPQFETIERQPQATVAAITDSEHQHSIMAAVYGSEKQQSAQKASHNTSDQQPVLKQQSLFFQRIEQNQQTANPMANFILGTSAQQAAPLPDPQSVAKSLSEAPNKAFAEGSVDKLSNNNSDKTMMSAPINVMVMEQNQNSSDGNPTSKVNLVPGSIPATAYFWSFTMGHTPKIQNYDGLKTEQNKAASIANRIESSDLPGNIQENPKMDYLYYQDQD